MANETGATPEQIERAARSAVERLGKFRYPSWEESPPAYQRQWIEDIEMRARYLVRPDERIVSADALRRVVRRWYDPNDCGEDPTVDEAYDCLCAALGGWTCGYCGGIGNDPKTTECSVCGTHQRDVDAALEGSR